MGCGGYDGVDGAVGVVATRGTDVEVFPGACHGGGEEWRRMVASMGDWDVDTEGADVEVSLCAHW